jgi:hypothetical protein
LIAGGRACDVPPHELTRSAHHSHAAWHLPVLGAPGAQWLMMALEGPFLAAIIARMGDPAFNLAAYGVSFALAILMESPVIMLMSASTALVEDGESYRRLRNFSNALNAGSTLLLLLVLVPPVYDVLMRSMLGLPPSRWWTWSTSRCGCCCRGRRPSATAGSCTAC